MVWPYEFVSLTSEEKHARREMLDRYGFLAHCSALAPVLVFGLTQLARLAHRYATGTLRGVGGQGVYAEVPSSPAVKARGTTALDRLQTTWAKLGWWMGDSVYLAGTSWGRREEWILGFSWTAWLLLLCTLETGKGQSAGLLNDTIKQYANDYQTIFISPSGSASWPCRSCPSSIYCHSKP